MGGRARAPEPVDMPDLVQSNEGEFSMFEDEMGYAKMGIAMQMKQNNLMFQAQQRAFKEQEEANKAMQEQQAKVSEKETKAKIEEEERKRRASKGKKDLLYNTGQGIVDDEEENGGGILKLGGR